MKFFKVGLIILAGLISFAGSCSHPSPGPVPTPKPTPTPTPTPKPHDPNLLLHRQGQDVVNRNGQKVLLVPLAVCCEGWPENGWPWVSESYLREAVAAGVNSVHIRLGPFHHYADGESMFAVVYESVGEKADLSKIRKEWVVNLTKFLELCEELKVQVEVDVIDAWQMKYPERHPWTGSNNVNGVDIGLRYPLLESEVTKFPTVEDWIRTVVDVTGPFFNVHYQDGNELFLLSPSKGYILSMRAVIRDQEKRRGFAQHMFWTNSGREDLENELEGTSEALDGSNFHQSRAFPINKAQSALYTAKLPRGVNEYDQDISPDDYARELQKAIDKNSIFYLWRGGMDQATYRAALAKIRTVVGPAATPTAARTNQVEELEDGPYVKPTKGRTKVR